MTYRLLITFIILMASFKTIDAQNESEVINMKDPITGKWGYASKIQNRKSPLKGIKKLAVNAFSNMGSSMISKEDAEAIDWVIPPLYDAVASTFSEQLAAVEIDRHVGYIDISNRFIIEPQFEAVKDFSDFNLGLAAVKVDGKFGYVDKKGEFVISPRFEYAESFKKNMLATIKQDGKYGAIDLTGKIVIPCKYSVEAAMTNVLNKSYRQISDSIKDVFQKKGYDTIIAKLKDCTDEVSLRINDSLWIQDLATTPMGDNNKKGLKDNYNRMILPCLFSNVSYDETNHLYIVCDSLNRYGVYSYKGDCIFHPLFDSIGSFEQGMAIATVEGINGNVGIEGWVDPTFMDEICNTGLQYDTNGDVRKARSLYERILTIDPNHVMALNNLAIIDINNKDYNKGMRKLKLAHKLAPDNGLIDENLHAAKKNRNERRWNRITTGLEVAAAVITIGAVTYSAVNGGGSSSLSSSGMSPSLSSPGASTSSSFESSSGYSSNSDKSSQTSKGKSAKKYDLVNARNLDRAYDGYESQLIKMKSSGDYSKDEVRRIQRKMKDIRQKMAEMGGMHVRAASEIENWNP